MASVAFPFTVEECSSFDGIANDNRIDIQGLARMGFFDLGMKEGSDISSLLGREICKRRHPCIRPAAFEKGAQFLASDIL